MSGRYSFYGLLIGLFLLSQNTLAGGGHEVDYSRPTIDGQPQVSSAVSDGPLPIGEVPRGVSVTVDIPNSFAPNNILILLRTANGEYRIVDYNFFGRIKIRGQVTNNSFGQFQGTFSRDSSGNTIFEIQRRIE